MKFHIYFQRIHSTSRKLVQVLQTEIKTVYHLLRCKSSESAIV